MSTGTVLARTSSAEWSRIWTVRSSWVFVLATALVVLAFGTIIGYDTANGASGPPPGGSAWDGGRFTAMFALFGVLAMASVTSTADHGSGSILPTLQWTPRRGVLFAARSGVIVATMTVLASLLVTGACVVVWVFVPAAGLPADDGARTLAELAVVFVGGALLAVGVGLLTRSTAGTLVSVIGLILVLPMLLAQLPYEWSVELSALMPGSGALYLVFGEGPTEDMTTTSARLTLATWATAAMAAGGWRLTRTDANR